MELPELKKQLEEKLDKNLPSSVFLGRMRLIDEDSRLTVAYNDPKYVPFYYWLGTIVRPKSLVEIGFRLGLFSANFLHGCKTIEKFIGFQEKNEGYYNPKLGKSNVRDYYKGLMDVHVGGFTDEAFVEKLKQYSPELSIINEEVGYDKHRDYLSSLWEYTEWDGLIVVDYLNRHKPSKEAFEDFCKSVNRDYVMINTRYGVGVVKK